MEKKLNTPAIICDADKLCQVAVIQALGRQGIPIHAISSQKNAIGFASRYVTHKIHWDSPSYTTEYIDLLKIKLPPGVLYYSNDANAENISRHKETLENSGFKLLIADERVISRVLNKDSLYFAALESNVKVPKSILVESREELENKVLSVGFPLIIKSTNLAGGIYRLVYHKGQILNCYDEMQKEIGGDLWRHRQAKLIIQEWIPQTGNKLWNFNALVKRGEIISYSMGERVRTNIRPDGSIGSTLLYGITAHDQDIWQLNQRLLKDLLYDGFMETEWSKKGDDLSSIFLYDFNPRPSGNIRWVFQSGVPMAVQYYKICLGLPLESVQAMKTGIKYFKILYHDNDFLISLENPRLTLKKKARVFFENLTALFLFPRHAIDILEIRDLVPTLAAVLPLPWLFLKGIGRFILRGQKNLGRHP